MRTMIGVFLFAIIGVIIGSWYESTLDPYEEGTHWDYVILCENGYVYKSMSRKGTIQIFNSDGTPLKCGEKIY